MKRFRWPIGVLSVFLMPQLLPAQFVAGPFGPAPIVGPGPVVVAPAPGVAVSYVRVKKSSAISFSLYRGGYGGYGPVYGPFAPTRVTQVIVEQPIVVLPDPGLHPLAGVLSPRLRTLPPDEEPPPMQPIPPPMDELPPLAGRDAGVFKPLDPDNRDRARRPVPPPIPPQENPKPPMPPVRPPDRPVRPPAPDLDPRQDLARRTDLGKEAFERGEYGRAAERFRQAADLAPNNAEPLLLLAQAHIALGNYRRAFDTIQTGLRLDPDWPKQPFKPIDLYGDNVADYAEHTQAIDDLLTAMPNDPVMLFLAGYQLWFDGRRDEAKLLLQRAAPSLPDPTLVDQFLQALPPAEIL
jgi:hypothetical protein